MLARKRLAGFVTNDFHRWGLKMTMILTCLTPDFVIQSSDRRVSVVKDNKVQWYDDHRNKALVYKSQFVFAYTGQAEIPLKKNGQIIWTYTIDWAAEQLSKGKNLKEAVSYLKYRAYEYKLRQEAS